MISSFSYPNFIDFYKASVLCKVLQDVKKICFEYEFVLNLCFDVKKIEFVSVESRGSLLCLPSPCQRQRHSRS